MKSTFQKIYKILMISAPFLLQNQPKNLKYNLKKATQNPTHFLTCFYNPSEIRNFRAMCITFFCGNRTFQPEKGCKTEALFSAKNALKYDFVGRSPDDLFHN